MLDFIKLGAVIGINPEDFNVCSYMDKYQLGFEELVKSMISDNKSYADMENEFVSCGLAKMEAKFQNLDLSISNLYDELKRYIEVGSSYISIYPITAALAEKTNEAMKLEIKINAIRKDFPNL